MNRASALLLMVAVVWTNSGCGAAADPPETPTERHGDDGYAGNGYADDDRDDDDERSAPQTAPVVIGKPTVVVVSCPPGMVATKQVGQSKQVTVSTGPGQGGAVVIKGTTVEHQGGHTTVVTDGPLPDSVMTQCKPVVESAPVAVALRPAPMGIHPVVRAHVQERYSKFRRCYEKGLRRNPTLAGRVVVRMKVDSDGEVDSAYDWGSDLPDRRVVDCIVDEYEDMDFDTFVGKIVEYPLDFSPSVRG